MPLILTLSKAIAEKEKSAKAKRTDFKNTPVDGVNLYNQEAFEADLKSFKNWFISVLQLSQQGFCKIE